MAVEASIVVVFGDQEPGENDLVVVELDPEHSYNLDTDGELKSVFDPENTPVFLLHHSDTLRVTEVLSSSGSVSQIGAAIVQNRTKDVSFVQIDDTVSLGYGNLTSAPVDWVGNIGLVELEGGSTLKLVGGTIPCIGTASFSATFQNQYMVTPPTLELSSDETYEILVAVYMEVI